MTRRMKNATRPVDNASCVADVEFAKKLLGWLQEGCWPKFAIGARDAMPFEVNVIGTGMLFLAHV
jgi:hypothetical protein